MESSKKCELEITQDELDEVQVTIKDVQENLNSAIKDIGDAKYALEKEKKDIYKTIELVTHVNDQLEKWLQVSMEAQKSKDEKSTLTPQKIFMEFSNKYEYKNTVIKGLQGIVKGFFCPMSFLMSFCLAAFDLFYFDFNVPCIPTINKDIQNILLIILSIILLIIFGREIVKEMQNHTEEEKKKSSCKLNILCIIFFLLASYELALIFQIEFPEIRSNIREKFSDIVIILINIITILMIVFELIREMNTFFTEDEEEIAENYINEVLKNTNKNIDVFNILIDSISEMKSDEVKIFKNSSLYITFSIFGFLTILTIIMRFFEVNTIEQQLNFFCLVLFVVDVFCFLNNRSNRKNDLFISVLKKMRFNQSLSKKDNH